MKKHWMSLTTREMHMPITARYRFLPIRAVVIKKENKIQKLASTGKDAENRRPVPCRWDIKRGRHWGTGSSETGTRTALWSSGPTSRYAAQRSEAGLVSITATSIVAKQRQQPGVRHRWAGNAGGLHTGRTVLRPWKGRESWHRLPRGCASGTR